MCLDYDRVKELIETTAELVETVTSPFILDDCPLPEGISIERLPPDDDEDDDD